MCTTNSHNANYKNPSTVLLVNDETAVILQTAVGIIADREERKSCTAKNLLDSCSQKTYIAETLVKALNLKPVKEMTMGIKTFRATSEKVMRLKQYNLCLKYVDNMSIYITALGVPTMCGRISGQRIDLAKEQHPFLCELRLANNGVTNGKRIDLLIGADFYWNIVGGTVKRDDHSSLIAISSKLGWLISGPVNEKINKCHVNVASTHLMKIECETSERIQLSEQIYKFWSLDLIGINDDEASVYEEKFYNSVQFKGHMYEVPLPFKDNHPCLEDNFLTSRKRLQNTKKKIVENTWFI